ncbi:MAG: 23S rRNA (guanosine(2251)-2'-O)-methyltransferase RlmB [Acidobacteriia bacterium]|nr:23S rRNA (guanosine(2251)-2'-O)-methyltransferase RlmB [Terriglobia bacterium]
MSRSREESAPDVVYGINAVAEAVRAQRVEHVMIAQNQHSRRVQEIIDACRKAGVSVRFAPRAALDRAAGTAHHQDVVAVRPARRYDNLEDLLHVREKPLLVVLDSVEDPRNLGAVVRTAVAAGADGLVIPERRAAGLSSTVAHAAAGALEHTKVARVTNLARSLLELKERGLWIYGFEASAPKSYLALDYSGACALVLGGEGSGLHRLVREACDLVAQIPLYGPVQSLNVSVAAAVVLYEAARQRAAASPHLNGESQASER